MTYNLKSKRRLIGFAIAIGAWLPIAALLWFLLGCTENRNPASPAPATCDSIPHCAGGYPTGSHQ